MNQQKMGRRGTLKIKHGISSFESTFLKKDSNKNLQGKLHTIYNTSDSSNFTSDNFDRELKLYLDAEQESGLDPFSYKDMPSDHLLFDILESKRIKYLNEWESKRIPIGSSFKSDETIISDFKKLCKLPITNLIKEDNQGNKNILWHFSHLASGLNQYFPEMLDTPTISYTAIDGLRDIQRFRKIYIEKVLLNGFGRNVGNFFSAFHRCFRNGNWAQSVGNFQPLFMKYLIFESFKVLMQTDHCLPNDQFVIVDPCAGWGGRLLGTLCVINDLRSIYKNATGRQLTISYITTDPNTNVHARFSNIIADWFDFIDPKGNKKYFEFHKTTCGCETSEFMDFCKAKFSEIDATGANLAMTSSPYFDREKYSNDPAQSFKMYPKYNLWKEGFLNGMVQNVYDLLVDGGRFYFNIADIKKGTVINSLCTDALVSAASCGFHHLDTYKMVMGNSKTISNNTIILNQKNYKYEPIFVLQK